MRLSHIAGFRNSILAAQKCEIRRQSLILRQSVKTRVLGGGWAIIALVMASILLMSGTAMASMIPLGGG